MWNSTYKHCITHGECMNLKSKWQKGFTLAETLITLGIIGIVAAMTIPTLVANYQKQLLETAFKKQYATLLQVISMLSFEFSNPDITATNDQNELYEFLYEHLQIIEQPDPDDPFDGNNRVAKNMGYLDKDGNSKLKSYSLKTVDYPRCPQLPLKALSNGTHIGGMYNCYVYWIILDTNGRKGPNAFGHDLFYFGYDGNTKTLRALGDGAYGYWNFAATSYCSKNSTNEQNGLGCTNWAVKNKCPDDDTKTYWECLP